MREDRYKQRLVELVMSHLLWVLGIKWGPPEEPLLLTAESSLQS